MNSPLQPIEYKKFYLLWERAVANFQQVIAGKNSKWEKRVETVVDYLKERVIQPTDLLDVTNLTTNVWGPIYWDFLHLSSILLQYKLCRMKQYTIEKIKPFIDFCVLVINLDKGLICGVCAHNYLRFKTEYPTALDHLKKILCSGNFIYAIHLLHNIVNEKLDKKHFTQLDFAKIYTIYPIKDTRPYIDRFFDMPLYAFTSKSILEKIPDLEKEYEVDPRYIISKIYEYCGLEYPKLIHMTKPMVEFMKKHPKEIVEKLIEKIN